MNFTKLPPSGPPDSHPDWQEGFVTPDPRVPIVVMRMPDRRKCQVTVRDGVAYEWRYKETDDVFCKVDDVGWWRGCGGFDY